MRAKDPVLAGRRKFIEANKAGDVDALVSLVTDDVVIMSPNDTTLYGKAEWKEWVEEYFQSFRFVSLIEPERDVVVNGDYATERSAYSVAIAPVGSGGQLHDEGRFLAIWKRLPDGTWKIWQMIWSSSKPIGLGTNRFMWRAMQKKARSKRGAK
jgi:ketosteroid isomerase-like protein